MQQAGYHQANALAQKISDDIKLQLHERDTQMLAILQTIPALAQSSTDSEDTSEDHQSDYHPTQVAASLTSSSDSIQLEMLRLLKELAMDIKYNCSVPNDDRKTKESQRETRKTPKEGGKFRKNISKYCWTHRACVYSSSDCPDRAKGHKTTATFQDKMDGSLARCK